MPQTKENQNALTEYLPPVQIFIPWVFQVRFANTEATKRVSNNVPIA